MPRTPECDQIEELLSALQDGAVTPAEQARVERHLADCADCRASAAAFQRVDERLRHYLQLTPVPPIAAPWRQERPGFAGWLALFGSGRARVTLAGVTTVLILVVAARLLTGGPGGKTTESATDNGAAPQILSATAAAGAAVPASGSGAASAQPTAVAGLAANAPAGKAASGASDTPTQAPPPRAAAGVAPAASPNARANAPAAAAGAAPAASPAFSAATINLAQRYNLASAASLILHTAATADMPLSADQQAAVVRALDAPVASRAATPPAGGTTELHFAFAGGQEVVLTYEPLTDTLRLPDGSAFAAPPTLAAVLMTIEAPR